MFADLALNLAASVIYDFTKTITKKISETERIQAAYGKMGFKKSSSDFPELYVEALVELRLENKPKQILAFFRDEDIMQTLYNYYYGTTESGLRNNNEAYKKAINHAIEALKVGDDIKSIQCDIDKEIEQFKTIFHQKVHESRKVSDVELHKKIDIINYKVSTLQETSSSILPKILTLPPFIPSVFEGRDEELTAVHQKLFEGQNFIMLVNGQGGIGKTSFAAKYWEKYQSQYIHLAFLFVEKSIADALLSLEKTLQLDFAPDMPTAYRLSRIIACISKLNKPCLLILDNANNEQDLNNNILLLRQCSNFHILLTSRLADFEHAQKYAIGSLDVDSALRVFKTYYKAFDPREQECFTEFFEAIGKNTLVLELFAKNLNHFNNPLKKRYTLQDLLTDIQTGLTRLSQSHTIDTAYQAKGTGLRNETPEAIIMAMYDLSELNETENQLLSVFSLLPAENISFDLLIILLNIKNLDLTLIDLAQKGWIDYNEDEKSFKVSPVIQEITRYQNKEKLLEYAENTISNLINLLESDGSIGMTYMTVEQASLFIHYAESVLNNLRPNTNYSFSVLTERIGNYYQISGNFDKALQFFNQNSQFCKDHYKSNPENEYIKHNLAVSKERLGKIYQAFGNIDKALDYYNSFNILIKELNDTYPENVQYISELAAAQSILGEIYLIKGNLDKALVCFNFDMHVCKELYNSTPKNATLKYNRLKYGLAISYEKLGDLYFTQGKTSKAYEFYILRLQLFIELNEANSTNELYLSGLGISYEKLGNIFQSGGNYDKALELFNLEINIFNNLYKTNPKNENIAYGLAVSYGKLSEIYQELGDYDIAWRFFSLCQNLFIKLNETNPEKIILKESLVISYYKRALLFKSQKNNIKGKEAFSEWKQHISNLAENFPQISKYKEWNEVEY